MFVDVHECERRTGFYALCKPCFILFYALLTKAALSCATNDHPKCLAQFSGWRARSLCRPSGRHRRLALSRTWRQARLILQIYCACVLGTVCLVSESNSKMVSLSCPRTCHVLCEALQCEETRCIRGIGWVRAFGFLIICLIIELSWMPHWNSVGSGKCTGWPQSETQWEVHEGASYARLSTQHGPAAG